MRKEGPGFPLKLIVSVSLSVLALIFFGTCVWQALKKSDYFKIKEVICKEAGGLELSYLVGRNIFSVNLKEETAGAIKAYPMYKRIALVRVMPNRIFVDCLKRRPLAYLKLYKYFYIDDEAVVFDLPEEQEALDLPQIFGLDKKFSRALPGRKYNIKELLAALEIIKEFNRAAALKKYSIKRIDLIGAENISFFLNFPSGAEAPQQVLEVRAGLDNIKEKVNILSTLFTQIKEDWQRIKYVDLRFKEPLIKFK